MLSQLLGSTFAGTGGFEGSSIAQAATSFETALGNGGFDGDVSDDTRPFAYLNYILFNDNQEMVDAGWQRVPVEAGFDPGEEGLPDQHRRLAFEEPIEVTETGYIYVWVSNESENVRVWFDDLTISHSETILVQATDYGVWGDVLREQKTDEKVYRYGYQGQFAEKDEETGWNHFELREYDPVIGRWTSTDPYGQYWSPYNGMGNDPVNYADPNGAYTKFGAWWRNGFSMEGVHQDGGEWGFLTRSDDGGFVPHYGDENIWRSENGQRILDRAWEYTGLAYGQMSTYDRIMARGGDGIEFDPLGQLAVVQPLVGGARALLSGTARVGQGILFGTSNRVFWSGGIGSAGEAAGSYAAANGAITLEMTFAGRTLTGLTNMTSYSFTKPFWNLASRGFANGARGSAEVFINPVNITSRSIWLTTERGVLRANGIPYNYNIISH